MQLVGTLDLVLGNTCAACSVTAIISYMALVFAMYKTITQLRYFYMLMLSS